MNTFQAQLCQCVCILINAKQPLPQLEEVVHYARKDVNKQQTD